MEAHWSELKGPFLVVPDDGTLEAHRRSSVRLAVQQFKGKDPFILAYAPVDLLGHLVDAAGTFSVLLNLPPEEVLVALKERHPPMSFVLLGVGRGCEALAHALDVFGVGPQLRAVVLVAPETEVTRKHCPICAGEKSLLTEMGEHIVRCNYCFGVGDVPTLGALDAVVRLAAERASRARFPGVGDWLPRLIITTHPGIPVGDTAAHTISGSRVVAQELMSRELQGAAQWIDFRTQSRHDREALATALSIALET